ncbi:MAG: response regulator [Blastocatellia bacterium]
MSTATAAAEDKTIADVLLVDDDPILLIFLSRVLEKAHFRVVRVNGADEALKMLDTVTPELIMADISMPGIDGYQFYQRVREMGLADVPFLFCSGKGNVTDRLRGLRMGADDYLSKPVEPEELVIKVRMLITRNRYIRALREALEKTDRSAIMTGNFGGITVADVLQTATMLGNGDFCVFLKTADDSGSIYLSRGELLHAETGWLTGGKAFMRMLGWEKGEFRIDGKTLEDTATMKGKLDDHLLNGLTQLDEFRACLAAMSGVRGLGTSLRLVGEPSPGFLAGNADALSILQTLQRPMTLDHLLDNSPLSDLETITLLRKMMDNEIIRPV